MKRMYGNLLLLLTAIIWGCAFVAQSAGMDHVGPFTYQATRSLLGAIVLIPVFLMTDRQKKKQGTYKPMTSKDKKMLWLGGICCGLALCVAANLQQVGILYTTVGKAGFITALYILIVPIFGLFFRKKVRPLLWICVGIAVVGLYLLCMSETLTIAKGDLYVFACAIVFAVHILVIDHFAPHVDCVRMSCIQFLVTAVLSGVLMLIFEEPKWSDISAAWLSIGYAGIFSCGVAYTLQIVAQKHTQPVVASLLLSLESVVAVIAGIILLKEMPTVKEAIGCVLMFAAIILAQLPEKRKELPPISE
ncbi:MAG: DMT family transporter [Christensenellaceae bacterium]|nr:DMT family transporter [Christensenellaceae bacterium]